MFGLIESSRSIGRTEVTKLLRGEVGPFLKNGNDDYFKIPVIIDLELKLMVLTKSSLFDDLRTFFKDGFFVKLKISNIFNFWDVQRDRQMNIWTDKAYHRGTLVLIFSRRKPAL